MLKRPNFIAKFFLIAAFFFVFTIPVPAAMNDYCITPPFIVGGVNPNLLLMIDNSASMFDLSYLDKGRFTGTCSGGGACSNTVSCPVGQTCNNITYTREPMYCYDQTYNFSFHYTGNYVEWFRYYEYNFTNGIFEEVASFPASCDKYIPGTLCINGTNLNNTSVPKTITKFVAEGNYLNWLSASKFDIQKQILTGGKYDAVNSELLQETRGCVGRRFIKEPIKNQTYVEGWTACADPLTCTSSSSCICPLGLTFGIRGPNHQYSETLLSPGGQTYLEIYAGNYIESNCQKAVDDIVNEENKNTITGDIELCLNYDAKGQYCSLDIFTSCTSDADCAGTPGTCNIVNNGVCGAGSGGVCAITGAGTCTPNNGACSASKACVGGINAGAACNKNSQCNSGVCSKTCVSGGKIGALCSNNNDCAYSACSAPLSKVGTLCSVNADCDLKTCTNAGGTFGTSCVVNTDCNNKTCTAGLIGNPCMVNTDCNSGAGSCTAPPASVGNVCTTNNDCAIGYKGVCQKPVTQQIKSTFGQSIHECYQYWNTGALVGNNWWTMMTNPSGCNQIYKEYKICNGGSRDGKTCVITADCTGGGTCINGPEAIRQGSPILVCGLGYVGYCASSSDNWLTTTWVPREYTAGGGYTAAQNCVKAKFEAFCGAAQVPPVTDPSDDPSSTENFDNLPAIIGDMAIGAQLGDPIATLRVNLDLATPPSGLIQEFEKLIHFGAIRFNYYGTSSECPANIPCNKICQGAPEVTCVVNADCKLNGPCVTASNLDGARIINSGALEGYILGRCSTTTTTTCTSPNHCPAGEACLFSVGDHSTGYINALDNIFASTWTPFSEGFYNAIGYFAQRTDTRINTSGDPLLRDFTIQTENPDYKEPIQYPCQKNNIMLITDGMSTADLNANVTALVSAYNDGDGQINTTASATCPKYAGSRNLDDMAWLGKHRNIKDFTETPLSTDPAINSKTITTHVVYNGTPSNDPGECNPDALLSQTASNGGGTYARAEDPAALKQALREAFLLIAGKAASGTAASVLASGEGTGANLVQAIFYPERTFGPTEIVWTGSMKNLWYYIDPFFGTSSIREDTVQDKTLVLDNDYIVNFFFNPLSNLTEANLFVDANGDGVKDSATPSSTVYFENIKSLWESGLRLWATLPAARTIYTTTDESTRLSFTPATLSTNPELRTLLQAPTDAAAGRLINYVRGTDYPNKFCSTTVATTCTADGDCPLGETCIGYNRNRTVSIGLTSGTWKLGDVVNSTPGTSSWVPLNAYHKIYQDKTYKAFTESSTYTGRGRVFVGANDGMLHAFNLGYLKLFTEKFKKAQMCNSEIDCTTTNIGREEWAFIPKNALPYLGYMADPSYCHLYLNDLTPYIFDASISTIGCVAADYWDCEKYDGSNNPDIRRWRTILIGGMRLGGACKDAASSLGVQVPVAGAGYSSYFALDITDQDNPQVLWEFSNADIPDPSGTGKLGFATTGPAVVRVATPGDTGHRKNGRWFVVFGSGPTGPINSSSHQFLGYSDQNLKLFVLDLKTGALLRTFDTGIQNAFAGSMFRGAFDFDQNDSTKAGFYSDEAVYFGYAKAENNPPVATTQWNIGGVGRLFTIDSIDPADWAWSSVMDNIGPVTASVAKLQNYDDDTVRLFFGTGRYFYKIADVIDDAAQGRRLYGVKEPCYSSSGLDMTCSTTVPVGNLTEATTGAGTTDDDGWYINLDAASGTVKAERNVTTPLATRIGAVFFTTTKPSANVCEFGGNSHLWAVQFDTGGAVSSSVMRGRALLQVSTGSIEEVLLKGAFTERDGRRTPAFQGVPPLEGVTPPSLPPPPMDTIMQIREK